MKNNLQSLLLTGVISSILTFGSAAALSEPAWTLPDNGIKVSVSEKQAYIKPVFNTLTKKMLSKPQ